MFCPKFLIMIFAIYVRHNNGVKERDYFEKIFYKSFFHQWAMGLIMFHLFIYIYIMCGKGERTKRLGK